MGLNKNVWVLFCWDTKILRKVQSELGSILKIRVRIITNNNDNNNDTGLVVTSRSDSRFFPHHAPLCVRRFSTSAHSLARTHSYAHTCDRSHTRHRRNRRQKIPIPHRPAANSFIRNHSPAEVRFHSLPRVCSLTSFFCRVRANHATSRA